MFSRETIVVHMETESEKEFRIPLISTSELEARSVSCHSQEESDEDTSLPALTNELLQAQHSQCTEIAEGQEKLSLLKVIYPHTCNS